MNFPEKNADYQMEPNEKFFTSYEYIITVTDENKRIDVFLSEKLDKTRSFVQRLIEDGNVYINQNKIKKNYKLIENDVVVCNLPLPKETEILPENIPLNIVYEDEHLLVVDKPKGMVVHPAPGNYSGTLVNALLFHCKDSLSGINGYIRPGIVHRIDKDTSGLLIVAKSDEAHLGLAEQIATHSFVRIYEAVLIGNLKEDKLRLDFPIGRHPIDRKKMAVVYENSKNATTNIEVINRYDNKYIHVKCILETGRTHQIRVHTSHIGHPVLGDEVYGKKSTDFPNLKGQCLLAKHITFTHPITKKTLSFDANMPEYFQNILSVLNNKYN